jgi:alpha-1,3-mannosyltransferase
LSQIDFLSIVIPTLNRGLELKNLLRSIDEALESTSIKVEILVVNDGSDEGHTEFLRPWLEQENHFLIESPISMGPSHARNCGVSKSSRQSDWVLFLDDDLTLDSQYFIYLQSLELPDNCVGIEGLTRVDSTQSPWVRHPSREDFFGGFGSGNILYRKVDFLAVGGFDEVFFDSATGVHFREDTDLGLRMLHRGQILREKTLVATHGSGSQRDYWFLVRDAQKYMFDPYFLGKNPEGREWIGGPFRRGRLGTRQLRGLVSDLLILSLIFSGLDLRFLFLCSSLYLLLFLLIFRDYRLGFYDYLVAPLALLPYPFMHSGSYWRGYLRFRFWGLPAPKGVEGHGKRGLRILHLVRQFWPTEGGMQGFVLCLSQKLLSMGHEVEILTLDHALHYEARFPLEETLDTNEGQIKIHRVQALGPSFFFWPRFQEFDWKKFDIIHVHGVDLFLERVAWLKRQGKLTCPLVLSTHGGFFHSSRFKWIKKLWFHSLTPFTLDACDKVLASSTQDLKLFKPVYDSVELLENGVNLEGLSSPGKTPDLTNWLYVGGFQGHKQLPMLIAFFSKVHKKYPEIRLNLVGEGIGRSKAEREVSRLGLSEAVCFMGTLERQDLVTLYQEAGLFVSASAYEGFGISVVEAMAAGCLLLLNEIPAFKSFIPEQGNGRLTCFSGSESALLAFETLYRLDDLCLQSMSRLSTEISQKFDWEPVSQEFENHYLSLISGDF